MAKWIPLREIFIGLGILFVCHVVMVVFLSFALWLSNTFSLYLLPLIFGYALVLFAFTQLLYVIPLYIRFKRRKRFNIMKGVIIGALITFLVWGGCFIVILWLLSSI